MGEEGLIIIPSFRCPNCDEMKPGRNCDECGYELIFPAEEKRMSKEGPDFDEVFNNFELNLDLPEPYPHLCPECNAEEGMLHKEGCDVERCSLCGGQYFTCDCEPVLFDYEPVPYIHYPLVCARCGKLNPDLFMVPDDEWEHYIQLDMQNSVLCRKCYDYIKEAIDRNKK